MNYKELLKAVEEYYENLPEELLPCGNSSTSAEITTKGSIV
jgi:hypothetical protein